MHAPSIISSETDQTKLLAKARGFAESLFGFIAGLERLVGQFLIPEVPDGGLCDESDTQAKRRRRWPERDAKNSHRAEQKTALSALHVCGTQTEANQKTHGGISANEFAMHRRPTVPLITFQHEQHMLTHIRRVEYTLRCFILWLVAQIIERAHETGVESFLASHTAPQRERYEEIYGEGYIPPIIRQQDRELRDNLSDKVKLSSFSVTTPLILSGKRKTKTQRRYSLLPDQLREVDARFILARIERLGKALKRADVMAERLAVRALRVSTSLSDPHRPSGTSPFQGEETQGARSALPLEKGEWSARTEGDKIGRSKPPNPFYFEPFANWLPPPDLYESGDEDEREVMNDLHFLASSGLKKLGFDPPEPTSPLPDFESLKLPQPPQIRRL